MDATREFVSVRPGGKPIAVAFSDDGRKLYTLDGATRQVSEISLDEANFREYFIDGLPGSDCRPDRSRCHKPADPLRSGSRGPRGSQYDVSSFQLRADIPLDFEPTVIQALGQHSFLLSPRVHDGDPLWCLTSVPQSMVFFVPVTPLISEGTESIQCCRFMGRAVVFSMACAALIQAQQIPFRLVVNQQGSAATVQNGATVSLNAPTGQIQTAQVTATYSGASQAVIAQQPVILGSTAFTVTLGSTLPITLTPGAAFSFEIQFRPATGGQNNANLAVAYAEPGSPGGNINLQLQGLTPTFVASYVLQSDQNTVPLNPGGAIAFPVTPVNTTAQAALINESRQRTRHDRRHRDFRSGVQAAKSATIPSVGCRWSDFSGHGLISTD